VLHRDVVLSGVPPCDIDGSSTTTDCTRLSTPCAKSFASAALSVPAALRVSVSATSISAAVSAADAAIGSSRWMSG
jgi:hypothetical protein